MLIFDPGENIEQVVFKFDQVPQHMAAVRMKEIDQPHIRLAVDNDVCAIEIAVHV